MNPDNQTPDEWLALAAVSHNREAFGTGLFLFPDDKLKTKVPDLTYEGCKQTAIDNNARAFKWVPQAVASFRDIELTVCGEHCNQRCMKPGCLCDRDDGICK